MKKNALLLLLLGLAFIGTPKMACAAPAKAPSSVIAIVDVQQLLQDSLAARSVQQQLESQRSKFQSEIADEEADLRKAEKKLTKMRGTAQTDAYAEEEQKLRQRFLTVERQVQSRRKALDQAFTESMNAVRKGIVDIVSAVAKERGVNLAIVKQQVIWNDQTIDITDEVLARLNKELPKLEVKITPDEDGATEKPIMRSKSKAKAPRK